jgi:hypothetical protein
VPQAVEAARPAPLPGDGRLFVLDLRLGQSAARMSANE